MLFEASYIITQYYDGRRHLVLVAGMTIMGSQATSD
jgi:hypothetical protein